MKKEITLPGVYRNVKRTISIVLGMFISINGFAQFTSTWPLTANQTPTTTGAQAANIVASNQVMSGSLFLTSANTYVGVTSGTAGDGQRCSPRGIGAGVDGDWVIDGSAVEGRYEEFTVAPASGFNATISDISFYIGNRSSSNLRASAYYYVGASNAGFTIGTGTALGVGIRPGTSSNQWVQFSYSALNISVPTGSKIYVRIYPYMTGSVTTGKYFCTKQVAVTGTTTSPNISNIMLSTPVTCASDRLNITWTGPGGYNPATTTLLAFLKPTAAVIVGTPTNALSAYTASTVFGTGTGYQNDGLARCIYKGTGTDAFGNQSGLIVTGLAANTTYHLLIFVVTNATSTYTPATGATGNGTTLANALPEPTNHVTSFTRTGVTTTNIPLIWTAAAAGAQAPAGYIISASNSAVPTDPIDGTDLANQTSLTSGTANVKVTPNTATTYSSFTGMTPGTMYYFRINSYTNAGSCINYKASGPAINVATLPDGVTSPSISISGTNATISWTAPATYIPANHTTLVFVKSATAVNTGTTVLNPAGYTANTVFGSGSTFSLDGAAYCVYNGDGNTVNISGLGAGAYHVLILTAVSAASFDFAHSYSAFVTTSATSGITYTWNASNTDWQLPSSWTPVRGTAAIQDILVFSTGTTVTPTNIPATQVFASLIVTGNTTLNLTSNKTLTARNNNGPLNPDLIINAGSTVNLSTLMKLGLGNLTSTALIAGTLNVNAGCSYNTDSVGALTTLSGTIRNLGQVVCSALNMNVTGTGVFDHAINGGTIPTATWNTGSTCLVSNILSSTSLSGLRQSFSNFIWDCPAQTTLPFVLGAGPNTAPFFEVTDNFIVRRTGTGLLQLTSSSGQRDINCGNYFQFGGLVAITYNTNDAGGQRSLTVNNTFYVTDSLAANTRFYIVSNAVGNTTNGRLYVAGNVTMRLKTLGNTVALEKSGSTSTAQLWFTGAANQQANFSTIAGAIDFVTAQAASANNVFLNTNATAANFLLTNGIFNIGANTLTINNAVSYPTPGTGLLAGTSASNLTLALAGNAGTLNFASGGRILKDLTLVGANTITLGTELGITAGATPGSVTLGSGAALNTGNNLIMRSDANGTSRIAPIPVSGGVALATINGTVTIERHLPMNTTYDARRWRLLTAPFKTTGSPTINAGWQEGVSSANRLAPNNPRPGYGTAITRSTTAANGFDQGSTNNSSIYYYSAGSWVAPANTNVVKLTDNSGAYMLFSRGDRSVIVSGQYVPANSTTLAPKGQVNTGDVTIALAGSGFQTIGNPYASQILLDNVVFNGTAGKSSTVYLWDPKALGSFNVGRFVTCAGNGDGTYTYTGNASNYSSSPGVIESSGAFMIAAAGGNAVFHETDKTANSSTIGIASRPAGIDHRFGRIRTLYADLNVVKNGQPIIADGVAVTYNSHYENGADPYDAVKLSSFNTKEQLSILRNGTQLAVERRKQIQQVDTIFLSIEKMAQATYEFAFRPQAFEGPYSAFLEDTYLHHYTPISLSEETRVTFNISTDAASAAEDRFRIVFRKAASPKHINLVAASTDPATTLQWTSSDLEDREAHQVQRSSDGVHFTSIAIQAPEFDEYGDPAYSWQEQALAPGNYFYRIGYTNELGESVSSNVVKISKATRTGEPAILPNPVENGNINLYMGQLATGTYTVQIGNSAGQLVHSQTIQHQQVNSMQQIVLKNQPAKGIYQLKLQPANGPVTTLKMMLQ